MLTSLMKVSYKDERKEALCVWGKESENWKILVVGPFANFLMIVSTRNLFAWENIFSRAKMVMRDFSFCSYSFRMFFRFETRWHKRINFPPNHDDEDE